MILYPNDCKGSTKNLLNPLNIYSKGAGYKIIMQNLVDVLCTNNEQAEKEIRKIILFTMSGSKNVKE
jgi:ATP-dependent phosphoenolpyruvate carboxykinase